LFSWAFAALWSLVAATRSLTLPVESRPVSSSRTSARAAPTPRPGGHELRLGVVLKPRPLQTDNYLVSMGRMPNGRACRAMEAL